MLANAKIKTVGNFYYPRKYKIYHVYSMTIDGLNIVFSTYDKVYETYSKATMKKQKVLRYQALAFSDGSEKETISETDTGKYLIRKELVKMGQDKPIEMESCYNYEGGYIGDLKTAQFLCDKMGIYPEPYDNGGKDNSNNVCCIGFCKSKRRWYGWSHRAIVGFRIGDRIFEQRYGNEKTPFIMHGSKTIKTFNDAKLSAINFAKYVG